jgi:hypothetical protein
VHAIDARTYESGGWRYRVVDIKPRCGHEPTLRNVREIGQAEVEVELSEEKRS